MARIDRELDHQYRMRIVQAVSVGWLALTRLLCVAVFCWFAYLSVRELAGRQTLADVRFRLLADLKASKYFGLILPWGLAAMATSYGLGQRHLRKRHIKRVSSEHSKIQEKLDPGRRSSHLSKKGETSPEDF
jgi:hypothetical protein